MGGKKAYYFLNRVFSLPFKILLSSHLAIAKFVPSPSRDSWIIFEEESLQGIALNTHVEYTYLPLHSFVLIPTLSKGYLLFTVESYKEHKGNWVSSSCTRNARFLGSILLLVLLPSFLLRPFLFSHPYFFFFLSLFPFDKLVRDGPSFNKLKGVTDPV